jgi:hypothetical protein
MSETPAQGEKETGTIRRAVAAVRKFLFTRLPVLWAVIAVGTFLFIWSLCSWTKWHNWPLGAFHPSIKTPTFWIVSAIALAVTAIVIFAVKRSIEGIIQKCKERRNAIAAVLLIFLAITFIAAVLLGWVAGHDWFWNLKNTDVTVLTVIRYAAASTAALGAVVALVTQYRKQAVEELRESREEDEDLTNRYVEAAKLLSGDSTASKLAGTFALERLAQDSERDRQAIMNLLCSFYKDLPTGDATTAAAQGQPKNGDEA